MSKDKAVKLLAKALDNSSKEEAITAFGMAWTQAQRGGVRLADLHVITAESAPISDDRERELVDKYNAALRRAKELRDEAEHWRQMYNYASAQRGTDGEAAEKLRKLKNYIKRL